MNIEKVELSETISDTGAETEALHDRYIALARAFAANPSPEAAGAVEDAYMAFYVAFVGSDRGLEEAAAELRIKMDREIGARRA